MQKHITVLTLLHSTGVVCCQSIQGPIKLTGLPFPRNTVKSCATKPCPSISRRASTAFTASEVTLVQNGAIFCLGSIASVTRTCLTSHGTYRRHSLESTKMAAFTTRHTAKPNSSADLLKKASLSTHLGCPYHRKFRMNPHKLNVWL